MALRPSGHIDIEGELLGRSEFCDQPAQRRSQILDRSLVCVSLAVSTHARTQLRMGAPDTVLVLLEGVGDMDRAAHRLQE